MPESNKNGVYSFDRFKLDTETLMLYRDEIEISLPPKVIKTLAVLVIAISASISAFAAPSVDGLLAARINLSPLSLTPVVITFDHKVTNTDFLMLQSLGISGGVHA